MTSGDPALAQALAQSPLMGFLSPLVNAHAESSTYPVTATGLPDEGRAMAATARNMASKSVMEI
jgi:hypothetical protein